MKSLIIVAHGSRKKSSNEELKALEQEVFNQLQCHFDIISFAFLEFTTPTIKEAFELSVDCNIKHVTVLPYFLSSGNHVTRDIPLQIKNCQDLHPEIKVIILPHIGASKKMISLISQEFV